MKEIICPICGEEMLYFSNVELFICSNFYCKGFIDIKPPTIHEDEKFMYEHAKESLLKINKELDLLKYRKKVIEKQLNSPEYTLFTLRDDMMNVSKQAWFLLHGLEEPTEPSEEVIKLALNYQKNNSI